MQINTTTLYESKSVTNNGAVITSVNEVVRIDDDEDCSEVLSNHSLATNTNNDPFEMRNKRRNDTTTNIGRTQRAKREEVSTIPL